MKHRRKPPGAAPRPVFVDETGRRVRRTQLLYRTVVLIGLGGLVALAISVLGGLPLPGLTAPVHLPSDEPAHPRGAPSTLSPGRVGARAPSFAPVAGSSGSPSVAAIAATPTATMSAAAGRPAPTPTPSGAHAATPASSTRAVATHGAHPTRTTGNTPTRTTGATPTAGAGRTHPAHPTAPANGHRKNPPKPTPTSS